MTWLRLKLLISATYKWWNDHNAPRLGAALAYYSLLSIAPLMILTVSICSLVFKHSAEQQVLEQTEIYVGSGGAKALKMMLDNAHRPGAGFIATAIALITLLFGASGVFLELRSSLNAIWNVQVRKTPGVRAFLLQRLGSFVMVIALGLLLLASLLVSAALGIMQKFASGYIGLPAALTGEAINFVFTLLSLTLLFALIYRFLPDTSVEWRDVGVGAIVTAILFLIGKVLLAVYFSTAAIGSAYGAAGSLVALVVWVYYSSQIFFFGAVFTRIFAERYGSHAGADRKASSQ